MDSPGVLSLPERRRAAAVDPTNRRITVGNGNTSLCTVNSLENGTGDRTMRLHKTGDDDDDGGGSDLSTRFST